MNRPALAFCAALAALAAVAGAAHAQPVATAQGRGDELTTAQQIQAFTQDEPPPRRTPATLSASREDLGGESPWAEGSGGPVPYIPYDAPPIARTMVDGKIHGEAGAEFGNRGYGGYGVVSGPLGSNGALQVGVSDYQGTGGRRGGYYNGDHKSVNVSAAFDFSRDRKAPPRPTDEAAPPY